MDWLSLWVLVIISLLSSLVFIARTAFSLNGDMYFTLFDDAMISMRYARNLIEGHGLVWNAGRAPVEDRAVARLVGSQCVDVRLCAGQQQEEQRAERAHVLAPRVSAQFILEVRQHGLCAGQLEITGRAAVDPAAETFYLRRTVTLQKNVLRSEVAMRKAFAEGWMPGASWWVETRGQIVSRGVSGFAAREPSSARKGRCGPFPI